MTILAHFRCERPVEPVNFSPETGCAVVPEEVRIPLLVVPVKGGLNKAVKLHATTGKKHTHVGGARPLIPQVCQLGFGASEKRFDLASNLWKFPLDVSIEQIL